jgi:hypothetical protein
MLLRKLRSGITNRYVVFSAPSRLRTEALIRRHGRIVSVDTADGWKVRDRDGRLSPASRGQAALYDALDEWRP